jgi:glycosyltransferase involved in cell wall biosynthesis
VLFSQYTNPAAYPPIDHAARLLDRAGVRVATVGVASDGDQIRFDDDSPVRASWYRRQPPGWRQRVHAAAFAAGVARRVAIDRPEWLYVSDAAGCLAAAMAMRVSAVRVAYHEHDAPKVPDDRPPRASDRLILAARRRVARGADLCVVPNEGRRRVLEKDTGRSDALVVWNTPLVDEAASPRRPRTGGLLRVIYQGSVVPARLPLSVIDALALLPASVSLAVAGYETVGHAGYQAALRDRAATRGVLDRVTFAGTVLTRRALLDWCGQGDVGLAFMPIDTADRNESTMVGASNKPFDYLARGLALVVADRPEWVETFVRPGYGVACQPHSADSIAAAIAALDAVPDRCRQLGEAGRQRVVADWHYERAFAPVLDRLIRRKQHSTTGGVS